MRPRSLLMAIPLLLLPLPVAAQSAPTLEAAIDLASAQAAVSGTLRADLDLDGSEEAVLLFADGCDGATCPWRLVGRFPDGSGWGVLAGGFGARTELVETRPSGHVIVSDGVILSWDGAQLLPYFDLLVYQEGRRGSAGEARELGRLTPGPFRPMDMRVHEFDPHGTGERWRLVLVTPGSSGPESASGQGPEPFHLLGPDGTLRLSGASIGRPSVYADQDDAGPVVRLVSLTGTGLLVESAR
jgi:hypothetical protein